MSDTDAASKTEEPTGHKLAQAREQGQVVKTPDLASLASLAAAASALAIAGGWICRNMIQALTPFLARPDAMPLEGGGGQAVLRAAMIAGGPALVIVLGAAAAAGVAANLLQTGFMFLPDKILPDFSKLSPTAGFKRVFGLDGLAQFFKSLVKVSLTAVLAWWVLKPHTQELLDLAKFEPAAMLRFAIEVLRRLVFAVAIFLLLVAGADWFWQRQRFMQRMRMTKEEVKEDFKNAEGDPHVKARLRNLRIQRAKRRMMQAVPNATVVVMNPTHYAVALKYDTSEAPAPLCVAKGLDSMALRIRAIAEEAGVPIIEDPPLARALYATVEVDDIIPPAHYEAVAKIIGFILQQGRRAVAMRR